MSNRPVLLRTRTQTSLHGQQHERLQEHSEVGPLRQTHLPVDITEDRRGRTEKIVVVRELATSTVLVFTGYAQRCVHLLTDGEAIGSIRLGKGRWVDLVFRCVHRWLHGKMLAESGHRLTVHRIHTPRLQIAPARCARRIRQQSAQCVVRNRCGKKLANRLAIVDCIGHVHVARIDTR